MIFNMQFMLRRMGLKRGLIFVGVCVLLWMGGVELMTTMMKSSHPDLDYAQRVLYQMMGEENLEAVGFYERYPEGKPSDFVAFLESRSAQKLWGPTKSEFEASEAGRAGQREGRLLRPDSVGYSAYEVDPNLEVQVVYIPDDAEGMIEFQGYRSAEEGPVQTSRWAFPSGGNKIQF